MRIRFFLKSNERVQLFWHQITSHFNKLFPFQTFNINEKHAFLPYLFSIIYNVQDGAIVRTNCTEFDSFIAFIAFKLIDWNITDFYADVFVRRCLLYFIEFYYCLIEYRMAMVDYDRAGLPNQCTIYLLNSPSIVLLWCYCCEAYI